MNNCIQQLTWLFIYLFSFGFNIFDRTLLVFSGTERKKTRTAIIIVVPSVIAMMLIISVCIFLRMRRQRIILKVSHLQSISFNIASLLSTYLRGVFRYQTEIMYLPQFHWTCLFLKWFFLLNNKLFTVWKL